MEKYKEGNVSLYDVYNGGKMRLFGWSRPVIVDLTGLKNIYNECDLLCPSDDDSQLIKCERVIASVWKNFILIQTSRKKAFGYSIGVEVEAAELVETGKRTINGIEHEAPFYHVTSSTLKEVVEQPNDDRVMLLNVTPDEMRKRIDELEKIKNNNEVIHKELQDRIRKLQQENDFLSKCNRETKNTIEKLRTALKGLVEASSPFCRQHQQFVILRDCVNNAAEFTNNNDPF